MSHADKLTIYSQAELATIYSVNYPQLYLQTGQGEAQGSGVWGEGLHSTECKKKS